MLDTDNEYVTTVVSSDDASVDLESADVVSNDDVPQPYRDYFDADEFYKLTATVARPIQQPYVKNGELYHFKKPAEELKKGAWSLDNKPWTLGHPETDNGMVNSATDVHGFWKDPRYDEAHEGLNADLYFPTADDEAQDFLRDTGEVSVGVRHGYEVADDAEDIDAYQTGLYFDHVASVEIARCPSEEGCGIDSTHAHVDELDNELATDGGFLDGLDGECTETTDCGCGCGQQDSTNMGDGNSNKDFVIDEMTVDSLRQRNDNVADALQERDDAIDVLESKVEELEDNDDEAVDAYDRLEVLMGLDSEEATDADDLVENVKELKEGYEDATDELEGYHEEERKELVNTLQSKTDLSNDELEEKSIDDLRDKAEFLEHVATDASATGVHNKGVDTNIETGGTNINPLEMGDD